MLHMMCMQASTGATPPLSQEELLAGALAAFTQEADSAALQAQSSLSASPSPEVGLRSIEPPLEMNVMIPQHHVSRFLDLAET